MDGRRFDDVARSLAAGTSRRGLLSGLVVGTLTGFVAAPRSLRGLALGGGNGDSTSMARSSDADCGDCPEGCDDGNACTIDTCEDGVCVHSPVVCEDDGDPCTKNVCINGECRGIPIEGACCKAPLKACGESCYNDATQFCCGAAAWGEAVCNDGDRCDNHGCTPKP